MTSQHTLFVCEITIHRAEHVPIGNLNNLSCNPYILASLEVPNVHPDYPRTPLLYRTPTFRHTLNPVYNARWVVGGIPGTGFVLTLSLLDEDPGDCDDRLGKAIIYLPHSVPGQLLHEGWDTGQIEYKVEKRKGSIKAHVATYLATIITRGSIGHHTRIYVSARVVGKVHDQRDRRVYTIGPPKYTRHFSPLIGHLISSGTAANKPCATGKNNKPLSASTFIANRLQLIGPTPKSLRHCYVGYAPFITSLFKKSGIRGKVLNYALHRQFHTIYGYDKSTVYGIAGLGEVNTGVSLHKEKQEKQRLSVNRDANRDYDATHQIDNSDQAHPDGKAHSEALSREFLRLTSYGTAGRVFTYVITLDSEWRFTETGEEFSVDLLSKHSMHANVAKEIAFSGEFFVRKISNRDQDKRGQGDHGGQQEPASVNLKDYELVIDNDSGTYRPKKELLPALQRWLEREDILGALGKVTAMDGFDDTLNEWKEERQDEKRRAKGLKPRVKKGGLAGKEKDKHTGEKSQVGNQDLTRVAISKKKRVHK